jgi:hypothetical protein
MLRQLEHAGFAVAKYSQQPHLDDRQIVGSGNSSEPVMKKERQLE